MTWTWSHPAYEAVVNLLNARTGLAFAPERRVGVEQGIRSAMRRAGLADPARYALRIAVDEAALDDLIVELTVGETYFFREPAQFEFLRAAVLPEIRRRRGEAHVLHAWSAACATGEEAYSLAIVCLQEGLAGRCRLLATDISRPALEKAYGACFGPWSLRGDGAALARPYLSPEGPGRFRLAEAARRLVTFEHLNLALDVYPSLATGTLGMDLILCRNVLIYFDRETVAAVARRLFAALADGGWLVTASSDPPLAGLAPFQTVVTERGIYYRRGVPASARATSVGDEAQIQAQAILAVLPALEAAAAPGPASAAPAPAPAPEPRRASEAGAGAGAGASAAEEAGPDDEEAILAEARADLARGDYDRAVARTGVLGSAAAAALLVRALANLDLDAADRACAEATARHPLASELHYLRAVLLLGLGCEAEAAHSARRAIYLDRSLAIAHFTLGSILQRRGDRPGARRCYRNAYALCAARPAGEVVPLTDGELAGHLAAAARAQMLRLDR